MVTIDLRPLRLDGQQAAQALENAGLIANKMSIPRQGENEPAFCGLRLGTPAATTLGLKEDDFKRIGDMVAEILHELQATRSLPPAGDANRHWQQTQTICKQHGFAQQMGLQKLGVAI